MPIAIVVTVIVNPNYSTLQAHQHTPSPSPLPPSSSPTSNSRKMFASVRGVRGSPSRSAGPRASSKAAATRTSRSGLRVSRRSANPTPPRVATTPSRSPSRLSWISRSLGGVPPPAVTGIPTIRYVSRGARSRALVRVRWGVRGFTTPLSVWGIVSHRSVLLRASTTKIDVHMGREMAVAIAMHMQFVPVGSVCGPHEATGRAPNAQGPSSAATRPHTSVAWAGIWRNPNRSAARATRALSAPRAEKDTSRLSESAWSARTGPRGSG
mmetsp:Transcript_19324/g.39107  ORF Transcript_19324/g.39107 Transcript_19324/m.39107 type:complete len:267 (-) Transcript_19324:149-949(-)